MSSKHQETQAPTRSLTPVAFPAISAPAPQPRKQSRPTLPAAQCSAAAAALEFEKKIATSGEWKARLANICREMEALRQEIRAFDAEREAQERAEAEHAAARAKWGHE